MSKAFRVFINQLRSPEYKEYFLSTHFWAPALTFGLPLGTLYQIYNEPVEAGSLKYTIALTGYSLLFTQFALKVQPKNNLLFVCHATNIACQLVQGCRLMQHQYNVRRAEAKNLATLPTINVPSLKTRRIDK